MNKFQKIFFSLILTLVLIAPLVVMAAGDYGLDATQKAAGLPTSVAGKSDIAGILGAVVSSLLGLIGVVFFILVLYAGLKWMLAMGNSEEVNKAKDILINAGIGLVIVAASYAITKFIFTSLGAGSGAGGGAGESGTSSVWPGTTYGAACTEDKDCKGTNIVCETSPNASKKGTCVTVCEYNYQVSGECVNISNQKCESPKAQESNLCPGGNNIVCCHNPS